MSTRRRAAAAVVLAHVEVAVAVELDDAALAAERSVASCSWWTACARGHVQERPAGVAQALLEVGLVGVDEERGVELADLLGRLAAHEHRAPTAPSRPRASRARRSGDERAVEEERPGRAPWPRPAAARRTAAGGRRERAAARRRPPPAGRRRARPAAPRRARAAARSPRSAAGSTRRAPRASSARVVRGLARRRVERDQAERSPNSPSRRASADRLGRSVVGRVVEHEHLALDARPVRGADRVEAGDRLARRWC